jgi:hypothetical protein
MMGLCLPIRDHWDVIYLKIIPNREEGGYHQMKEKNWYYLVC